MELPWLKPGMSSIFYINEDQQHQIEYKIDRPGGM